MNQNIESLIKAMLQELSDLRNLRRETGERLESYHRDIMALENGLIGMGINVPADAPSVGSTSLGPAKMSQGVANIGQARLG